MTSPNSRRMFLVAIVLAVLFGWHKESAAAPVKGTVSLPSDLKTGRLFAGYWRVENTNVALQQASLRGGTVVLMVGPLYQAIPPKTTSVELSGLQANPPTVVVSEGSVVEFKNSDKVAHDLSIPELPQLMGPERLASGTVRKQRFGTAGEYRVRCTEYPHIVISVIVTSSPLFAVVEDKGGFKIPDVPEGHAILKVWSNGRWVHEEDVDITSKGLDVSVRVKGAAPMKESTE